MKNIATVIADARRKRELNQSELARRIGVTPQSVQAWESGKSIPRPHMLEKIANATGCGVQTLLAAMMSSRPGDQAATALDLMREILRNEDDSDSESVGPRADYHLADSDDVEPDLLKLPTISEVELEPGSGRTVVKPAGKGQLEIRKQELTRLGVDQEKAVSAIVRGDSNDPILPDGAWVGIDTGSTIVRDGKLYAINQDGQLRIRMLHRQPDGGIKMVPYNRPTYPEENYSPEDIIARKISILGRVFWSQVSW